METTVKKKMPKLAKVAIWIGSVIVGLFVIFIVAAIITAIVSPPVNKDKVSAVDETTVQAVDTAKADAEKAEQTRADEASKLAEEAKVKAEAEKAVAEKAAADEASAKAAEDAKAKEAEAAAAEKAAEVDYGQQVYDAWLESRGVTSSTELLMANPENIQGYLVSAESPSPGTVVFTAQVTKGEVTKAELEQGAMAVLQLVGFDDETLDRVEIKTADSLVRGVANRHDSLLLNLG
ncbi:hypothetical protein ART_1568 [Arthrobacter sp. PAMC 25486]|uniref:hypothetical protein n=1 Tax=Arthrobacter sp. PAMC 25486 TaxID=1494608 RepID=UPI000535E216|nr:hypothetical protein [Arthrobacter sp. PAMC 25486]AIY01167.1 hypothetical protein ART_1568 [Arthrobacter sp. PAMC 25486]